MIRSGRGAIALRMIAACALAGAFLAGCNVELLREHPLGCRSDEKAMVRETLYFGASIPGGGEVGAADWRTFENDVLTPAFPQGYTVIDANGKWRGTDGATRGERSRIVVIVHVDDARSAAAVRGLVQRYRKTFHQEAVLRERSTACVAF